MNYATAASFDREDITWRDILRWSNQESFSLLWVKTYECPLFLQPSQEALDPTKHFAKEGLDVHAVIRSMPLAFLLRTVKQVVLLGSAVAGAGVVAAPR